MATREVTPEEEQVLRWALQWKKLLGSYWHA
jgi:hypothetical protein